MDHRMISEFQLVGVDKLIPYVNNARTHSPEQINKLRASLREFGFINPIIVDKDYNVVAGHGRLIAAKAEGFTEVPCVYVDHLTEAQKKAYMAERDFSQKLNFFPVNRPTTADIRKIRQVPSCGNFGKALDTTRRTNRTMIGI